MEESGMVKNMNIMMGLLEKQKLMKKKSEKLNNISRMEIYFLKVNFLIMGN
jgi:hypothetical protein